MLTPNTRQTRVFSDPVSGVGRGWKALDGCRMSINATNLFRRNYDVRRYLEYLTRRRVTRGNDPVDGTGVPLVLARRTEKLLMLLGFVSSNTGDRVDHVVR